MTDRARKCIQARTLNRHQFAADFPRTHLIIRAVSTILLLLSFTCLSALDSWRCPGPFHFSGFIVSRFPSGQPLPPRGGGPRGHPIQGVPPPLSKYSGFAMGTRHNAGASLGRFRPGAV